ncbi:hypothetical protein EB231_02395 [Mesorhizobium sp. NZP2298]|nr:hypothetical protein EB231_02395 [Mesorhizobium sp. NZP2298]
MIALVRVPKHGYIILIGNDRNYLYDIESIMARRYFQARSQWISGIRLGGCLAEGGNHDDSAVPA